MLIDRLALVAFFDDDEGAGRHATAIKGVAGEELGLALLMRYLTEAKRSPVRLPGSCTQGARKGHRLDAWVQVTTDMGRVLYQVEVKTWSAHSIGGTPLPLDASAAHVRAYKLRQWNGYFDPRHGFREETLQKVFDRMICPEPNVVVEPLACLWTAVHDRGHEEPFFRVPIATPWSCFDVINVFSMSAYLRTLTDARIELHLPDTERRLEYLANLFPENRLSEIVYDARPGVASRIAIDGTASID
jgi:hypothetical protein